MARLAAASILLLLCVTLSGVNGLTITLTRISTAFAFPIGIDYHQPSSSLVMTANYPGGTPENFRRVNFLGQHFPWSGVSGLTDEVKIATVKTEGGAATNPAGFVSGDLFAGTGVSGQIIRITNNGASAFNPWCSLGDVGLMRGSLYVDRTGVYSYNLVVVTTGGYVYRIDSTCTTKTRLAYINTHLEGLVTVPNDPVKYGGFAGKIVIGAEATGYIHVADNDPNTPVVSYYGNGILVEDLDLVNEGENFFGINYGTGYILGADWSQFINDAGKILVTTETPRAGSWGLYFMTWENNAPKFEVVTVAAGSAQVGQWEHVTFSPTGIREILPADFCINVAVSQASLSQRTNLKPIKFTGSVDAVSNYRYSASTFSGNPQQIPPEANTLIMYLSQDYRNDFALTIIMDKMTDGSAGTLDMSIQSSNLGPNTVLKVFDDPTNSAGDTADQYQWANGAGRFQWTWGACCTDGGVIDQLGFVTETNRFKMEIKLNSYTGITAWKFYYFTSSGVQEFVSLNLDQPLIIERKSCNCGDSKVGPYEQCDGGVCCNSDCMFQNSAVLCRAASNPLCDVDDYCTGNSATCPADGVKPQGTPCRPENGICDIAEVCNGASPQCPTDAVKSSTAVCRSATGQCDIAETCDGTTKNCPADQFQSSTTVCDDQTSCTDSSHCLGTADICTGVDVRCNGTCGDGIVAASEQCDSGNPAGNLCCTAFCTLKPNSVPCRNSTGRCDPVEYCGTNPQGQCPPDVNNLCPTCDDDCNSSTGNGLCISNGVCNCTVGWTGPTCSTPVCGDLKSCGSCFTNPMCGWCCESSRCLLKESANGTCARLSERCACTKTCQNGGTCQCGTCACAPGFGGDDCTQIVGCDGVLRAPGDNSGPKLDVCSVCGGNGTTCLGCDGKPFTPGPNRCGSCTGDDSCWNLCPYDSCGECQLAENCIWCTSQKKCYNKANIQDECAGNELEKDKISCNVLSNIEVVAVGLSAGIVAAIAISSIVGAAIVFIGGKKGYDIYKANRNRMEGASNNPMYTAGNLQGENPFYDKGL